MPVNRPERAVKPLNGTPACERPGTRQHAPEPPLGALNEKSSLTTPVREDSQVHLVQAEFLVTMVTLIHP